MMAGKPSASAGIFDDEAEVPTPESVPESTRAPARSASASRARRTTDGPTAPRRSSHPGKTVPIHVPEDMHGTLQQFSLEEGSGPLAVVTARLLRQYPVRRGHAGFAP